LILGDYMTTFDDTHERRIQENLYKIPYVQVERLILINKDDFESFISWLESCCPNVDLESWGKDKINMRCSYTRLD